MSLKIKCLSDLHAEFGNTFIPPYDGEDVLVLAGDIDVGLDEFSQWFVNLLEFRDVVYIKGNHELYHHDLMDICNKFPLWAVRINQQAEAKGFKYKIHALQNSSVVFGDVMFIGATLWTNFNNADPVVMHKATRTMNDYQVIKYLKKKLTPLDIYREHCISIQYIEDALKDADSKGLKKVLVTHHPLSYECIHPFYRVDVEPVFMEDIDKRDMNYLFYSDREDVIAKADLSLHGHVHHSVDIMVKGTRVVCNPFGYITHDRNPEFNPNLIIEV